MPQNREFFDCVNSFERLEKSSKVIEKCERAIEMEADLINEAIVHSLLMSTYAKQGNFEEAREQLLLAREELGKVLGLEGENLRRFTVNEDSQEQYFHILDEKVDPRRKPSENSILTQIMLCPVYPRGFREDLTDTEKRDASLNWWADFPGHILYLLLGDLWAAYNEGYSIKCLKILKEHEQRERPEESPPSFTEIVSGYKLGLLLKARDVASAIREFKEVTSALSYPEFHNLPDNERMLDEYFISEAKKELTSAEQSRSKTGLLGLFRKSST